jgi:hypothetical protein
MQAVTLRKRTSLTIIHCVTPLFLGGLLYILFRSTELRMFNWLSFIGLDDIINSIKENLSEFKNHLPNWIYYSLPDGLWVYSFTSALLIYWNNDIQKVKLWLLIPFITGVIIEILQGFKMFIGTFDFLDLTFSTLGFLFSKLIINHKYKQNEKTVF